MTGSPELDEAAVGVTAPSVAPADEVGAGDAAFWGASRYRSGGVGWREFLAIDDGDDADFTTTAAVVTGDDESAAVAVALNPPRSALSELASSSWPEPVQSDPAPEAFGSWSTSPDDLLPSR